MTARSGFPQTFLHGNAPREKLQKSAIQPSWCHGVATAPRGIDSTLDLIAWHRLGAARGRGEVVRDPNNLVAARRAPAARGRK
jgi:hypothetical protein